MKLPLEICEAISWKVGKHELYFADNYRGYRHKDGKFQEDYNKAYDHGCCGFFDVEYVDDNGDTWTIGCNYGH